MSDKKPPIVELRQNRVDKLDALKDKGLNPFPSACGQDTRIKPILDSYEDHEGNTVTVAGRLISWRPHGSLVFAHIQDSSGRIQLFLEKKTLQGTDPSQNRLGFQDLNLLDIGDFVEAAGEVTKSRRGEISVHTASLRILTKSLRPLPEKWHGIKDRETVLRKRYLHCIHDPEHKGNFELISHMLYSIREFLTGRGFLEFNTPILQPQYGGGTAKPFITTLNALHTRMYLAISHELYLKRLIAAGYDRVFTIGRYFRNEGIDRTHHPEFSMIETMTAFRNYEYNMDLIEELFRHIAVSVFGRTEFTVKGNQVDFAKSWERISMLDAVKNGTGKDFSGVESVEEANSIISDLGLTEPQHSVGKAIEAVFEELVGPTLIQPTLVYGHPMEISPLAKPMDDNPDFAERFEIFIGGTECGDNWTEQNDPILLLEKWKSACDSISDVSEEEWHPLDYDFIEVLEHGLPPTTGIGPGIERMAMVFLETENIDDVIFFPLAKPVLSEANAAVYSIDELPIAQQHAGESVVITFDQFKDLLSSGNMQPAEDTLSVTGYLHIMNRPGSGVHYAAGHIEVEGFLRDTVLSISGYSVTSEQPLNAEEERTKFEEYIQKEFREKAVKSCNAEIEILEVNISAL